MTGPIIGGVATDIPIYWKNPDLWLATICIMFNPLFWNVVSNFTAYVSLFRNPVCSYVMSIPKCSIDTSDDTCLKHNHYPVILSAQFDNNYVSIH